MKTRGSDSEDECEPADGLGSSHIPQTVYIIKFHPNTRREAIEWLIEKIEAKQKYGGAELLVRCEPQIKGQGVTIHVSATKIKLLEVAEVCELQKKSVSGLVQEFTVRDLDQFLCLGQTLDTLLTPAEREFCVRYELEGIRAKPEESHIPGYPEVKLYPGQSLTGTRVAFLARRHLNGKFNPFKSKEIRVEMKQGVSVYIAEELVSSVFPLHDRQLLENIAVKWYRTLFQFIPFDEIRSYFGESVALYFNFLGFYTSCLLVPAGLGLSHMFFSKDTFTEHALFSAFNMLWVTLFLECWKRRSSELAYTWGTLERTPMSEARAKFRGTMRQNPVTARFEPHYPGWRTKIKLYFCSLPVVVLCILGALCVMVIAFWWEEQLVDLKRRYGSIIGLFTSFPFAIYAVVVWIMNFYYRRLATALTIWENHRTQFNHDWHRVAKLVAFEVVNNFSSLFYIAFCIQDMDMLCTQVATMLIVTQMINHFREALLPYYVKIVYKEYSELMIEKLKSHPMMSKFFSEDSPRPIHSDPLEEEPVPVLALDPKDPRIGQVNEESQMDPYEDVYEDYLEMFLQFGYVFLFSSVYPMAAFWAVLNNVLELKTDTFKLCKIYQRPRVKLVGNIGVWQGVFELMGVLSVITNCALLCLSPRLRAMAPTGTSKVDWILLFVLMEHIILAAKVALMWLVPDQPTWVRRSMETIKYHAKLALKSERGKKSRRHLSRRFRSVHGMPRSGSRSRGTTPVSQNGGVRHRTPVRDYQNYNDK